MFQLGDNVEGVGVDLVLGDVELSGVEPRRGDGLRVQHLGYAVIFTAGILADPYRQYWSVSSHPGVWALVSWSFFLEC